MAIIPSQVYTDSTPNLANPHLNGPPTMADLLFDYYAKAQYPTIGPLVHPEAEVEAMQEEAGERYDEQQKIEEREAASKD